MTTTQDDTACRPERIAALARTAIGVLAAGALAVLAACGSEQVPRDPSSQVPSPSVTASPSSSTTPSAVPDSPRPTGSPRPMGHIHGLARDPATGDVLLATHGGLFRLDPSGPTAVGPVVDLMGFTVAADGSYLASGHPGQGTDLPNPVGLLSSTDGGATWSSMSRGGESDFHGLTAGSGLVAGFDGRLRVSPDGRSWTARDIPAEPHVLALSPNGDRLLATTREGLLLSRDAGVTWAELNTPALLVAVDWADTDTIAGVDVTGRLALSEDGGATWRTGSNQVGEVTALHASATADGVELLVVVGGTVMRTIDLGSSVELLL